MSKDRIKDLMDTHSRLILELCVCVETVKALKECILVDNPLSKDRGLNFLFRLIEAKVILNLSSLCSPSKNEKYSITKTENILNENGIKIGDSTKDLKKEIEDIISENSIVELRDKHIAHIDPNRIKLSFNWNRIYEVVKLLVNYSNKLREQVGFNHNIYSDNDVLINIISNMEHVILLNEFLRGKGLKNELISAFELYQIRENSLIHNYKVSLFRSGND